MTEVTQQPQLDHEQIKTALSNTLSNVTELREGANHYLNKICEPNPQFQITLLQIIRSLADPQGQLQQTVEQRQLLQYQSIICMKNSIMRLLQQNRGRGFNANNRILNQGTTQMLTGARFVSFSGQPSGMVHQMQQRRPVITDELRQQIKNELLQIVANPDNVILSNKNFEELTLVVTLFIKYDFPANWTEINQWILVTLEELFAGMQNLQQEDAPKIQRFLGFYYEVLKEQTKKQLTNQKSQFIKVARDHLRAVDKVWKFFNAQQRQMIYDEDLKQVILLNYNQELFQITSKLDKILMLIVKCGFSITNLLTQPENNIYVETIGQLIGKLEIFTTCCSQVDKMPDFPEKTQLMEDILIPQVKSFLKKLSDLQESDNFLMYNTLDKYLSILANILYSSEIYNERISKLTLIATFRVVKTDIYNAKKDITGHHDGIGMVVSPVKFKNLEPQIEKARELYLQVMDQPIPHSDSEMERNRQDGARQILQLVTHKFLSKVDLSSWQSDPEHFVQNEDEQFLVEFDLQDDNSLNLIAQHLIEKLLQKFYHILYPYLVQILDQYLQGQFQVPSIPEEDALLNLVGIIGKVQREHRVKQEKLLDVSRVFQFIKDHKWKEGAEETPLFKRRFLLVLTHWVRIMPKTLFNGMFETICGSLATLGILDSKTGKLSLSSLDTVLVYEHCHCIHEMLKEIHKWLQRGEQLKKGEPGKIPAQLPKDIGELRGIGDFVYSDSEEDQITLCLHINSQINYAGLFKLVCAKLTPLFDIFKQPSLTWSMINFLSMILEQMVEQPDSIDESLRLFNILKILEMETEDHVYEAIIDMLKNLLIICPHSPIILNKCCDLLDFMLNKNINDWNTVAFWLFTMRAVSEQNSNLPRLKQIFLKYFRFLHETPKTPEQKALVSVNQIKKDYIYQEFLQVANEAILLNMFNSQEIGELIHFVCHEFDKEIQKEKQQLTASSLGQQDNQFYQDKSEDDGSSLDESTYEKKANLIMLQQIILQKSENSAQSGLDEILNQQKPFLLSCCVYLIESKANLTLPGSNIFFQQLVTYINRVIITKQADFINGVLIGELSQKGFSLCQFVQALLNKMDHIVSWEANRIMTLTLMTLLPFLTADIIKECFFEIGRLTFTRLEEDLFLKLSNEKALITYSPNRFKQRSEQDYGKKPNAIKIRMNESFSSRYKEMKREDWLLEFDQIEIFMQKVKELMANLNIQSIDPLVECLKDSDNQIDEDLQQKFRNLVNGHSPKFEERKKQEAEQLQSQQFEYHQQQQHVNPQRQPLQTQQML